MHQLQKVLQNPYKQKSLCQVPYIDVNADINVQCYEINSTFLTPSVSQISPGSYKKTDKL